MNTKAIIAVVLSSVLLCAFGLVIFQPTNTCPTLYPKYPMDSRFESIDPTWLYDENGVIMLRYASVGLQYNPVTVSQYAIYLYHKYYDTRNETFKDRFLIQVNWLVETVKHKGNFSFWEIMFDWDYYGMKAPFVSAMAQGEAISVLIRAHNLTSDPLYFELIGTAINVFEVDTRQGGVRYTDPNGYVWFEEYADTEGKTSNVLNGFIFALLGLYEASEFYEKADELFKEGLVTLVSNLHKFDTGKGSYYDLLGYVASPEYHDLHIQQLETLYNLTNKEVFLQFSQLFQAYVDMDLKPQGREVLP
ncbi:MAG: hypothetical protein JSV85_03100 [Candidatus Bathyarchaeota archaeon]|nr:MAG: hypothetical protein JSV85_03100 [Candidatus Bathyarchaeota archaeon]